MSCSNCYNGCPEIISDQCVRYTGVDVPVLGIQNGDSLSYVEQALVTFLTSTLDGTGIKLDIDPAIICAKVQQYLVTCEDITAKNLFETLIKVVCDLQSQITSLQSSVTSIQTTLNILNADYNVDCLTGVTNSSDTHAVVQAIINKLCQFIIDVGVTYVKISDLNSYISTYLTTIGIPAPSFYRQLMIPYIAYEYYGPVGPTPSDPLSGFAANGAGYGKWVDVYLCNGENSTPDKRGRVAVGVTTGMGGSIPLDPAVDPVASPLNPNYTIGNTTFGSNGIILSTLQLAPHNHGATAVSTVTDPGHTHTYAGGVQPGGAGEGSRIGVVATLTTASSVTGVTVNTAVTIADTGGGDPHPNNQPGIGAYYIMYRP